MVAYNKNQRYREYLVTFGALYGVGPWSCHFCGEEVRLEERNRKCGLHVHHLVEGDNSSVVPTHASCHRRHHMVTMSEETRAKLSQTKRAAWAAMSPEERRIRTEKWRAGKVARA